MMVQGLGRFDVAVVGAGILGLSTAFHLAHLGLHVVVLEAESVPAQHASSKNAGMIRQLYRHAQLTEWTSRSLRDWPRQLKSKNFRESGSLVLGRHMPGHHGELFRQEAAFLPARGEEVPAVRCETDGLLDSRAFMADLSVLCQGNGVDIRCAHRLLELDANQSGWRLRTSQAVIESDVLVNAAGAWLNEFLPPHLRVTAQAFARHLFLTDGWAEGSMPVAKVGFVWDEMNEWYVRYWSETQRLISLCDEEAVNPDTFVSKINPSERLQAKLSIEIPDIASQLRLLDSWHCFRTYTPDQLPIFGWDPALPNLFWMGAFGGFGMSTGFGAGFDAAQCLISRASNQFEEFCVTRTRQKR